VVVRPGELLDGPDRGHGLQLALVLQRRLVVREVVDEQQAVRALDHGEERGGHELGRARPLGHPEIEFVAVADRPPARDRDALPAPVAVLRVQHVVAVVQQLGDLVLAVPDDRLLQRDHVGIELPQAGAQHLPACGPVPPLVPDVERQHADHPKVIPAGWRR
jgi:hypothetical protein